MIVSQLYSKFTNPVVPKVREVRVVLFIDLQAVVSCVSMVCLRRDDINWVTCYYHHLLSLEMFVTRRPSRPMCLGNHDLVRVTNNVLTKKTHHSIVERTSDRHISSGEDPTDLLKVSSQECVSTSGV